MAFHAEARDLATTELHSMFGLRRARAAATTEFGAALAILDITQAHAGRLFQVSERHVRRWKRADRSVPVGVAIVLRLLTQGAVSLAQVELAAASISAQTNGGAEGEPLVSLEEPPAPLEEAPEQFAPARAPAAALAILALGPASCRWPLGDPGHLGFRFCSAVTEKGPYCADHYAQAHLAPRPQQAPVGGMNGRAALLPTLLPSAGFGEQRLADNQITTSSHSALNAPAA